MQSLLSRVRDSQRYRISAPSGLFSMHSNGAYFENQCTSTIWVRHSVTLAIPHSQQKLLQKLKLPPFISIKAHAEMGFRVLKNHNSPLMVWELKLILSLADVQGEVGMVNFTLTAFYCE